MRFLRGEWFPDFYRKRDLDPDEKEKVRIGTLLAFRTVEACDSARAKGIPCCLETPKRRPGVSSVFKFTEVGEPLELHEGYIVAFVQRGLGARTNKPTEILLFGVSMHEFLDQCYDPSVWWDVPWFGAAH